MENYKCPQCGEIFGNGQKFCPNCGCDLDKNFIENPICPVCHKHYPCGVTYCSEDGAKLVKETDMICVCEKCGTVYSDGVKFCPKDGGHIVPKYTIGMGITNQNVAKANLLNRLIAAIIDSLITGLLSVPSVICYTIGMATMYHGYYETTPSDTSVLMFILAFLLYILPLVYAFIKDGLKNGQSIGKKCMNLKVIKYSSKQDCTKTTSALRNLVSSLLCLIPLGFLIEPIMVLATDDGRKVGDKAADTLVINV